MSLMAVSAVAYVEVTAKEEPEDDNDDIRKELEDETDDTSIVDLITGTDFNDTLTGDDGMDRIAAGAGDDLIAAGDGDDEARGGIGDDVLFGGDGDDSLHGEDGIDSLFGGAADDSLVGHEGDDALWGGVGEDSMQGSAGDDLLFGGDGDDALQGGLDNDTLSGDLGEDTLFGGWGDDVINGLFVETPEEPKKGDLSLDNATERAAPTAQIIDLDTGDFLNGGGGDDTILTGNNDTVTAGEGADDIVLGDWLTAGQQTQILDYEPQEDSLLFVWDDSAEEADEPEVRLTPDPENEGQLQVWMGDQIVAQIAGNDPLEDANIALIPLSAMEGLGLVAA